ncbi:MAG: hypothetical protein Q9218_005021 [Villophora microphyllina]
MNNRKKTKGLSDDLNAPRDLTTPLRDPPTVQLLRDLQVHTESTAPSLPQTPEPLGVFTECRGPTPPPHTPRTQWLSGGFFGSRKKHKRSKSREDNTADPVAGPIDQETLNLESPSTQLRSQLSSLPTPHNRSHNPFSPTMDSRFLAPAAHNIIMTKQKERTIRIAKEQQQAIVARLEKNNIPMPSFEFLELIGKGAFGRVFKANDLRQNKVVALKVLDVDPQDFKVHYLEKDESIQSVLHEINVLTQLRDSGAKNINAFIEAFPIHSQLWIVTEYCPGGSLHTLMQGVGSKLNEKYIIPVARELAIALQGSHAAGIIHRDVKEGVIRTAANVMIHENGSLQLIDFGVAGLLQTSKDKRSTIIGTPHWMAPEVSSQLVSQGPPTVDYATEVDVWAYGCTLYEIATGHPPYHRAEPGRMLNMMIKRSAPKLNEKDFSPGLVDLIKFVMKQSPQDRPTMETILQHPYIRATEQEFPTESLADLVKIYYGWEMSGGQRSSLFMPGGAEAAAFPTTGGDDEEDWNFSTTMNFDSQNSAPYLAAQQHAGPSSISNLTFDFQDQPSHLAAPASTRLAASNHPASTLHKPRPSLNLAFSMSNSTEMDPSATFKAKDEANIAVTDAPATANTKGNVERGEKSLQAIFDQSAPDYLYGADSKADDLKTPTITTKAEPVKPSLDRSKSDLPLRNATSGLAVHKEVDKFGIVKTPSIDLSSVDTIKANRINSRSGLTLEKQGSEESDAGQKGYMDSAKRATMDWTFPSTEDTTHDQQATMPARANNRGTLDWSFATAEAVQEEHAEHDIPPIRPALRHTTTQPVGKLDPRPKSILDLDALYESEPYDSSTAPASDDEAYAAYDLSDAQAPVPLPPSNSPPKPPPHPKSSFMAPVKLMIRMLEEMHYTYEVDPQLAEAIILGDRCDPNDLTHGNEQYAEDLVENYLAKNHAELPFFRRNAMKRDIMDARIDVFSKYLRGDYPFEDYITKFDNECFGQPYTSDSEEEGDCGAVEGTGDDAAAATAEEDEGYEPPPKLKEVDMRALLPGATDEQLETELKKQLHQISEEVLPWAARRIEKLAKEWEEEEAGIEGGTAGELDLGGLDINEGEEGGDEA